MRLFKYPKVTSNWYTVQANTSTDYQGKNFEVALYVAKHAQSTGSLKIQLKTSELFMKICSQIEPIKIQQS